MKRAPRERAPRAELVELPGLVVAELTMAADNHIERAPGGDGNERRTSVQFASTSPMLLQQLTTGTMVKLFPELTAPHQPETALRMLNRLVAKRRKERARRASWVTSW